MATLAGKLPMDTEYDVRAIPRSGVIVVLCAVAAFLVFTALDVPLLYFHILLGLVVLSTALVNFEAAFLFVPLALTNPYQLAQTGTNLIVSEYVLMIIFIAWFVRMMSVPQSVPFPREFLLPISLLLAASVASLGAAHYVGAGVLQVVRYIEVLVVLFLVVIQTCRDERQIRRVVLFLVIGGLAASLLGLWEFLYGTFKTGENRRIYGMHGGGYGAVIATTFLLAVGMLIFERGGVRRVLALITVPIAGVALILSQTRSWLGGLAVGLVVVVLQARKKSVGKLLAYTGLGLLFVFVLLQTDFFGLLKNDIVANVLANTFRLGKPGQLSFEDLSLFMRFNVWYHAVVYFLQSPVLGVGMGNLRFSDMWTATLGPPGLMAGYVDNQYLQVFAEAGILAGVCWILYLARAVRAGMNAISSTSGTPLFGAAFGLYASLLVYVIGSFFWVVTPHHEIFALMVIEIGLLVSIVRLQKGSDQYA
jgi:O-antigen ligase